LKENPPKFFITECPGCEGRGFHITPEPPSSSDRKNNEVRLVARMCSSCKELVSISNNALRERVRRCLEASDQVLRMAHTYKYYDAVVDYNRKRSEASRESKPPVKETVKKCSAPTKT